MNDIQAAAAGARKKPGRDIGPCNIMADKAFNGMKSIQQYAIMRQIDEERMRQRVGAKDMPVGYRGLMRNGNLTLRTLLEMCDRLGIRVKLYRKDGEPL